MPYRRLLNVMDAFKTPYRRRVFAGKTRIWKVQLKEKILMLILLRRRRHPRQISEEQTKPIKRITHFSLRISHAILLFVTFVPFIEKTRVFLTLKAKISFPAILNLVSVENKLFLPSTRRNLIFRSNFVHLSKNLLALEIFLSASHDD